MQEPSARVRGGLSYVCEHLDALREHLDELGRTDALDRLVGAVVDDGGEDPAAPLDALDRIVREDGDARGAYGTAARTVSEPRIVGLSAATEAEVAFLCPLGACARVLWATPAMGSPPSCGMSGAPLRWVKH
ncbi:hypothetical protein ACFVS7_19555 [Streptomyces rubiginosohelvolus]|uniref:hypothetical protein n=1 Tax=Streptomyces rubiginosohelvolus TaxID=67362 RepID=UPI0013BFA2B9|nr:hypothetical protein [Streptomyces sp. SID6648]